MHRETDIAEAVDLRAIWEDLVNDPDAPARAELTEHGELVVSPLPTRRHQIIVALLSEQLREQLGGIAVPGIAILTPSAGVRWPDIAWMERDRIVDNLAAGPMEIAPPFVVEVLSPGNRREPMAHKIRGYLGAGVHEVAVVGLDGSVVFHRADGAHPDSVLGLKLSLPAELFY